MKYQFPSREEELALMREKSVPYSYKIKNSNKEVLIFGLSHTSNEEHSQFEEIKGLINDYNPNAVLFEIPKKNKELLYSKDSNDAIKKIGEIRIISDMIDDSVKKFAADNLKIKINDIDGFSDEDKFILKLLIKTRSICKFNKVTVMDFILGELQRNNKMELKEKVFTYVEKFTKEKIDNITKLNKIIPTPIDNFNELNNIMRILSLKRDEGMIDEIIKTSKEFDRIIFFVGCNHVLRWEKILKKKF